MIRERLEAGGTEVQLHADESLSYDRVSEVLAACREAGADGVVVMTDPRALR